MFHYHVKTALDFFWGVGDIFRGVRISVQRRSVQVVLDRFQTATVQIPDVVLH